MFRSFIWPKHAVDHFSSLFLNLCTWWGSNGWPKHVIGSVKWNVQNFRSCDCVNWTESDNHFCLEDINRLWPLNLVAWFSVCRSQGFHQGRKDMDKKHFRNFEVGQLRFLSFHHIMSFSFIIFLYLFFSSFSIQDPCFRLLRILYFLPSLFYKRMNRVCEHFN